MSISQAPPLVAGSDFSLWLEDTAVPAAGFTDADVLVEWDPTLLTLGSWAVDAAYAFGIANVTTAPQNYGDSSQWLLFTITRDQSAPQPGSFGPEILRLDFDVNPAAGATMTAVNFYSPFNVNVPGYYQFDAVGAGIELMPVPEPAALALMLAGVGVVAGAARRRSTG